MPETVPFSKKEGVPNGKRNRGGIRRLKLSIKIVVCLACPFFGDGYFRDEEKDHRAQSTIPY